MGKRKKKPQVNTPAHKRSGRSTKVSANKTNVGKVYYGKTSCIDNDTRPRRRFVVVNDNGQSIKVSKLKTIKKFDNFGNNADEYLLELDKTKYPKLKERTGVDSQVYNKNRRTKQKLTLTKDNGVFDCVPDFELDCKDKSRVIRHVRLRGGKNKGNKKGK